MLYLTGTSLNIESFMGSIMCLGVSVSNSVMLVTFMDEHWKGGSSSEDSAIAGAGERLRPILMTACAMTVGMVPMALALERGSQMQAPLGRAVIGGLVMSTFATLLVVPSVFALVIGKKTYRSPSIYPDDRESRYYDPNVFASRPDREEHVKHEQPDAHELIAHHTDDEVIGLLRSMIHEIRQKRAEMVTHHSADDLLAPLGFTKVATAEGEGRDQGAKDGENPGSEGMS
jgi:predicted RND superfamily exporter protein